MSKVWKAGEKLREPGEQHKRREECRLITEHAGCSCYTSCLTVRCEINKINDYVQKKVLGYNLKNA